MERVTGESASADSGTARRATEHADAVAAAASGRPPVPQRGAPDLSSRAEEFLKAKLATVDAPSREERVAALQTLVASGDYAVDGQRVAGAMLKDESVARALGLNPTC